MKKNIFVSKFTVEKSSILLLSILLETLLYSLSSFQVFTTFIFKAKEIRNCLAQRFLKCALWRPRALQHTHRGIIACSWRPLLPPRNHNSQNLSQNLTRFCKIQDGSIHGKKRLQGNCDPDKFGNHWSNLMSSLSIYEGWMEWSK